MQYLRWLGKAVKDHPLLGIFAEPWAWAVIVVASLVGGVMAWRG